MFPPLSFSRVRDGIYRSAYPSKRTFPFIAKLNLKALICVNPSDIRSELRDYAAENSIKLFAVDIGHNQEPFIVMSEECVNQAVSYALG